MNLFPMNFEEFLMAISKRKAALLSEFSNETVIPEVIHRQLWQDLKVYYITGGMPEAVKRSLRPINSRKITQLQYFSFFS